MMYIDMVVASQNGKVESEMDWLADQDPSEIAKYQGKYIAIWKHEIIGVGKTGSEARRKAKQKEPDSNPTVFGVPPEEGFIGRSNFVKSASC